MNPNNEAMREAFEAEIRKIQPKTLFIERYAEKDAMGDSTGKHAGTYKHGEIESMWQGWLLARAVPAIPQTDKPTDTERLDFIEANPEMRLSKHKGYWSLQSFTNYAYDVFKTLREAIDAKISAKE